MSGASGALEQLLSEVGADAWEAAAGFDCSAEGTAWRLRIWGRLAPTWAANVSLHCYAARIGIIEGEALRLRDQIWAGTFLLGATTGGASPDGFDFLQMARRRPSVIPGLLGPEIIDMSIDRNLEQGSVILRVVGRDQLGFLAHVLRQTTSCGLEPRHISFRTTADGIAHDGFVLLGIGGTPPTDRAIARLRRLLQGA